MPGTRPFLSRVGSMVMQEKRKKDRRHVVLLDLPWLQRRVHFLLYSQEEEEEEVLRYYLSLAWKDTMLR